MKKAILIVKKTYAFHRKTRIRQGYVVTYVFFDPIGKSKFLMVQEPKMLESMITCVEYQNECYSLCVSKFLLDREERYGRMKIFYMPERMRYTVLLYHEHQNPLFQRIMCRAVLCPGFHSGG